MKKLVLLASGVVTALGAGCGGSDPSGAGDAWQTCTEERDRWERCEQGSVIWCHAFGTPHFHSGARCQASGLACLQVDPRRAVCADTMSSCEPGEFRCDGNTALNCVGGILSQQPCGSRKECTADAGVATCFDPRPSAPCSGFGDLYQSGCVCVRGYEATQDGEGCVPAD